MYYLYTNSIMDQHGRRKSKRFTRLQECRQWIADATYIDEHTDIENAADMLVEAWFEYWIGITMNLYVHITEEEKLKEIDQVSAGFNVG